MLLAGISQRCSFSMSVRTADSNNPRLRAIAVSINFRMIVTVSSLHVASAHKFGAVGKIRAGGDNEQEQLVIGRDSKEAPGEEPRACQSVAIGSVSKTRHCMVHRGPDTVTDRQGNHGCGCGS